MWVLVHQLTSQPALFLAIGENQLVNLAEMIQQEIVRLHGILVCFC